MPLGRMKGDDMKGQTLAGCCGAVLQEWDYHEVVEPGLTQEEIENAQLAESILIPDPVIELKGEVGEAPEPKTCRGTRHDGKACQAVRLIPGTGYCQWHQHQREI